tara:strand:- start:111 stop:302 length:192 start_codon:yes stop_codon:yes gene_type:complete
MGSVLMQLVTARQRWQPTFAGAGASAAMRAVRPEPNNVCAGLERCDAIAEYAPSQRASTEGCV